MPSVHGIQRCFSQGIARVASRERELDFTIELKIGVDPISKTRYRMMAPKLCELQMPLKELLDQGLIKPSVLPWGTPMIFVEKKDQSL